MSELKYCCRIIWYLLVTSLVTTAGITVFFCMKYAYNNSNLEFHIEIIMGAIVLVTMCGMILAWSIYNLYVLCVRSY